MDGKDTLSDRINNFRNTLKNNQILEEFDRHVFESIIEKVIIGGIDKDGNKDPYMITFIYKTGLEHEIEDAKKLWLRSKEWKGEECRCAFLW